MNDDPSYQVPEPTLQEALPTTHICVAGRGSDEDHKHTTCHSGVPFTEPLLAVSVVPVNSRGLRLSQSATQQPNADLEMQASQCHQVGESRLQGPWENSIQNLC